MRKSSDATLDGDINVHNTMRSLEDSLPLKLLKARETIMDQFRPQLNAHGVTAQQGCQLHGVKVVCVFQRPTMARMTDQLGRAPIVDDALLHRGYTVPTDVACRAQQPIGHEVQP